MKVKFLGPVQHDADVYQEGDTADLPNAAAKSLIACGAAEQFDPAAAKAAAKLEAEAQAKAQADAEAAEKAAAEAQALADAANKPA